MAAINTIGRPREDCLREAEAERRSSDTFDVLAYADGLEASVSDYVIWFGRRDAIPNVPENIYS